MHKNVLRLRIDTVTQRMSALNDSRFKAIEVEACNIFENMFSENESLLNENQSLKNQINTLKGEQGKPSIRKQPNKNQDHSSEKERKQNKSKKKKPKRKKKPLKIDKEIICKLDLDGLPDDVAKKGYKYTTVQDIEVITTTIKFKKESWYSPSTKQTFIAKLPAEYPGGFSARVIAMAIDLHASKKMTHSAIHNFFSTHGLSISPAEISRMLTDKPEVFHQEKNDIVESGLSSSIYQQMDDTGAKERGQNKYTHILCNEYYTSYFTKPNKSRLTIIDILTQEQIKFAFNKSSYQLMQTMKVPNKYLGKLQLNITDKIFVREEIDKLLDDIFPELKQKSSNRRKILDASALVAYYNLDNAVRVLLTDDAPQYRDIANHHALCWVHDGRHYKKLNPIISKHKKLLKSFLKKYWKFYRKLLSYKEHPTDEEAHLLSQEFDKLFSTVTGYEELDERINFTKLKKNNLLLVLQFPQLPLHNNSSELGARAQARYRDISLHTMNEKGTKAKDTLMTINETAKKLGVNTYQYFYDRISKNYNMTSLAELIKGKMASDCLSANLNMI
jgi:hypothetical protein